MSHSTLGRHIKRTSNAEQSAGDLPSLGRFRQVFTPEQEKILEEYLIDAANIYFGLSPKDVRVFAYECAVKFKIEMPEPWQLNKQAGADRFSNFMKRHPSLSIRTPEATSLSRATSFNKENVASFFKKLAEVIDRESIQPCDILNVDETGITTVQKPRNIVAPKGVKQIGTLSSAERGAHVTMCASVSATGNSVPPMFIFPSKNYHDHFVRDGPVGSIGAAHPSGWMTGENFTTYIKHFASHAKPSLEKKVLLLLDNHDSHISIETLNFAKSNGIVMLSFPPHCSHKLQPLDRSVFGPFKRYVNGTQDAWMRNHPGSTMTIYDIPGQVKTAWPLAAKPTNIMSGFQVSGVYPFDVNVFGETEYAPCSVTDRPLLDETLNAPTFSPTRKMDPMFRL